MTAGVLDGAADGAVVVDTGDYDPQQRDGRIAEDEDGLTESEWVSRQLGVPVVKALDNVYADGTTSRPTSCARRWPPRRRSGAPEPGPEPPGAALRPIGSAVTGPRPVLPEVPVARPRSSFAVGAAVAALLAAAAVVAAVVSTGPAAATDAPGPDARGITVSGTGTASGTPDVLRFTVGVQVAARSVDAAMAGANSAQTQVLAVLRQRGVADRDLQTADVRLEPRYDDQGRTVTGYVVHQDVRVSVRDLEGGGETISAAVAAGGDAARLSGVQFVREDDDALRVQARDRAFAAAKAKAEQYAGLTGRELGAVQTVVEHARPTGLPYAAESFDTAASTAVPLAPGSTEVSVDVQVRWALR